RTRKADPATRGPLPTPFPLPRGEAMRPLGALSLVNLALFFASCAGQQYPDLPVVPTDDPEFDAPEEEILTGFPNDSPQPLRLRPGDVLTLQTISVESDTYEGLIVDARGNVHVPLAGDIHVGGASLTEA